MGEFENLPHFFRKSMKNRPFFLEISQKNRHVGRAQRPPGSFLSGAPRAGR
jgi:hypothetical protein